MRVEGSAPHPAATDLPAPRPGLPRVIEVTAAFLGLLLMLPLLLLLGLAVAATSPGPVLFVQERVGRSGQRFPLFKLRSMRAAAAGPDVTGRVDARITPLGRWLRRTKLDELPQLWNVIRGDMSLVGPRPEVARYTDLANPLWRRVLEVRPGITDPLTLKLRHEESLLPASEEERERFYVETLQPLKLRGYLAYLSRRSGWTDLGVILATLAAVLRPGPAPSKEDLLRDARF
jgi:lipopolysaccharide/colanic/teichoic acid biosynthesis glycosyltransferase